MLAGLVCAIFRRSPRSRIPQKKKHVLPTGRPPTNGPANSILLKKKKNLIFCSRASAKHAERLEPARENILPRNASDRFLIRTCYCGGATRRLSPGGSERENGVWLKVLFVIFDDKAFRNFPGIHFCRHAGWQCPAASVPKALRQPHVFTLTAVSVR